MRIVVVIPAYNEAHTVGEVIRSVRAHVPDVIVVDDGSDDATGDRARHAGAHVVTHCVNRGLGAALGTGITAALGHRVLRRPEWPGKHPVSGSKHEETYPDVEERADIIVTLDADGQHDPADIAAVVAPVLAGLADVVIGTRFSSHAPPPHAPPPGGKGGNEKQFLPLTSGGGATCPAEPWRSGRGGEAPIARRLANSVANLVTRFLFGIQCSDTQSGFRCLSRHAAQQIEIRTNRMEVSSEILAEAVRHELRIVEVPIRTIYTEYSLSKGQGLGEGIRTAWSLLLRRLF